MPDQQLFNASEKKVKLPSIKELTIGLPNNEQAAPPLQAQPAHYQVRHHSLGSASSSTSPQQVYYNVNNLNSQPAVLLPATNMSTNSSISSASSSIMDGDRFNSRKSSITTSVTPPYQSTSNFTTTPNSANYIVGNPQYDMLNYKIQQTHPVNPFEHLSTSPYSYQQPQLQAAQLQHQHIPTSQPKKKRPRRKANEMERLYACNWKNCKNSYGTLNHLNAHITFKRHGPKRKPEEFKQIRELYKLKKTKLEKAKQELSKAHGTNDDQSEITTSDENIKLLANLSESFFDGRNPKHIPNSEKIAELPIFHQQRGYNGYGRHSYTLKQAGNDNDNDISISAE